MNAKREQKLKKLQDAGILNAHPEKIQDEFFEDYSEFFDAYDLLQVRYEMLRAHLVDGEHITKICKRYGISRQTLYTALERFEEHGCAGLLPRKSGPQAARKLTPEVVAIIEKQLAKNSEISGAQLTEEVAQQCGVEIHKRTIEKFVKEFRLKKNS